MWELLIYFCLILENAVFDYNKGAGGGKRHVYFTRTNKKREAKPTP